MLLLQRRRIELYSILLQCCIAIQACLEPVVVAVHPVQPTQG